MNECPNCGADLPPNARACPECGSDEQTGWSEAAESSGLDLPDDSFNYGEFVKREFEGKDPVRKRSYWFWWVVAIIVLAALGLWLLGIR